ncbi:carbonic anhydrase [Luedemannella flava]|uniref:carbonic anhydrase n=1 Tax=Luedemannella flava TaxID=349316 RepID=A0ABP4XJF6_9ACTN
MSRRSLLLAGGGVTVSAAGLLGGVRPALADPADREVPGTPAAAWARLYAGNRRFVVGRARHPRQGPADLRRLATGQHPFCIGLTCADSRVPPELVFDQGLGDIFDNRVAGNIVDDLLLGSIEFAVGEFHSPLIVVLGHERCGAIVATVDAIRTGRDASGHIGEIVEGLRPVVEPLLDQPGDVVDNAVSANVRAQVARLTGSSDIIAGRVASGGLRVIGARYDLDEGQVTVVD